MLERVCCKQVRNPYISRVSSTAKTPIIHFSRKKDNTTHSNLLVFRNYLRKNPKLKVPNFHRGPCHGIV